MGDAAASNISHRSLTLQQGISQAAGCILHPTQGTFWLLPHSSFCQQFGFLPLMKLFPARPEPHQFNASSSVAPGTKLLQQNMAHPFLGTGWHLL